MSAELDARLQGVEGDAVPSQAGLEDTSVSEVSDRPTACHSGVQVEQQADSQVNTGRADAEAVRQSHGDAKRRRGSGGRLDTRFDDATLGALRTRAKRLGLAPSTWVRSVVRDALHAARSEELDAAVAAHLLGVETRVQASADTRELAAQVRPLAINVNDLDRRARAGEAVSLSADVPELIELLREVRALLGDRTAS
ncbi:MULTISPECIES: hypothetical protein [Brevibacterium]|uniref:Uncharacterized protein n=2 Tax=Brevibacterium antiquum TaxID=234835 RepID=A0A2H1HT80_9MICO|nr:MULTISPECIES: hypothetical protein [Brevibacterium]MDN6329693.1 hypothetical protein [Brachybacterium sp.]SMX66056.1 hypothetical protein BANT918_00440 [Brevibacterium antiquum CNRZ 918]SMX90190.1 hypothetical protein BANT10_02303 [Brevibacterium antiquum]HCG56272.1 hypothetical protein [Brevibacterium sp.]